MDEIERIARGQAWPSCKLPTAQRTLLTFDLLRNRLCKAPFSLMPPYAGATCFAETSIGKEQSTLDSGCADGRLPGSHC